MAIRTFKEIIDNKGFRLSSKDREIFEEGSLQSFFGMSNDDYIEFIVYDVNDNQLPLQITDAGDTAFVKYIPLTSETIRNYFMISEGTRLSRGEFPKEYFIDIERLLRESGYDNGIFKTQITLINRRLGTFDDRVNSKMWIKEISPSRTEVRLLPQRNSTSDKTDILTRYQIFKNDGEFRDDNIYFTDSFVTSLDPSLIEDFIRSTYSDKWLDKLERDYGINIQTFSTRVYAKFKEAIQYEFSNRISSINDVNYGKLKDREPTVELSVETIKDICERRLVEIINFYLPERITADTESDIALKESIDETGEILQRKESDVKIQPSIPDVRSSIEKIESLEEIELQSKIDDEITNTRPAGDPSIKVVNPSYAETRRVSFEDDNTLRLGERITGLEVR